MSSCIEIYSVKPCERHNKDGVALAANGGSLSLNDMVIPCQELMKSE